jgi:hypothetical protein
LPRVRLLVYLGHVDRSCARINDILRSCFALLS